MSSEDVKIYTDISTSNVNHGSASDIKEHVYVKNEVATCENILELDNMAMYVEEVNKLDEEQYNIFENEFTNIQTSYFDHNKEDIDSVITNNQDYVLINIPVDEYNQGTEQCKVCWSRFHTKEELRKHLIRDKDINDKRKYVCCVCLRRCMHMYQLQIHMRVHTGEKPYDCKICGKLFATSNSLTQHVVCHTGERKFECERCHKKFARPFYMKSHQKTQSCLQFKQQNS